MPTKPPICDLFTYNQLCNLHLAIDERAASLAADVDDPRNTLDEESYIAMQRRDMGQIDAILDEGMKWYHQLFDGLIVEGGAA